MLIRQEDILSTGNLELLARKAVEGFITGYHQSPFHGFSVEFAEHRQYNPGESIRHVDWRLFGRTDKLFVKRYEEETNLRCRLLIDASSSMQFKGGSTLSKLQYSAWCAAVFVQLMKRQRDAVGLDVFDEEVIQTTSMGSSGRHYRELMLKLGDLLDYQSVQRKTDLPSAIHDLARRMHRRSMVVLFTDLFAQDDQMDALFNAIQHLKHNKQEVIIFHILHQPTELEFEYGRQAITFEDMETGERLKVLPHEMKESYQKEMKAQLHQWKLKCAQYKIDLVEVDAAQDVGHAIIPFLIKRNKLSS